THRLPQPDRACVGADDEVELHALVAEHPGALERTGAHRARHAAAARRLGDHVAAVAHMPAAAGLVAAQVVGADDRPVVLGDERVVRQPPGERRVAGHLAVERVSLAGTDHRLEDRPDRVGVFGRGRTDQHAPQTSGARDGSLAQLAVLAAAPVDADGAARGVAGALAGDAGAHSGERAAPRPWNALAAIVAMLGALPERRFGAGAQHRVLHRVIDLR